MNKILSSLLSGAAFALVSTTPLFSQSTPAASSAEPQNPAASPAGTTALSEEEAAAAEAAAYAERLKTLGAQTSGAGKIGNNAEITIPEGYTFFGKKGTQTLLQEWGNLINGSEEGLINQDAQGWVVIFEFDPVGYVKDDEKNDLDAAKMLKQMQDAEPEINKMRAEKGLPTEHILGFAMPPKYNEATNNLEWALRFRFGDSPTEVVNYHTKLLGRDGVMNVTLIVPPDELQAVLPDYQKLLTGYHFTPGHTYAEYRSGDKLATYGLTGLVLGGAGFAAAKTGLLAKLGSIIAKGGKVVIIGIAAIGAALWKILGKLFGKRDQSSFEQ